MRGVSAIIVVILILILLISLIMLFWTFLSDLVSGMTEREGTEITYLAETISSCMKIDSIAQNQIYIRNCGEGVISDNSINIYVNDEKFNFVMSPTSINKGELAIIYLHLWGMTIGEQYEIRIANPKTEVFARFETILPSSCVLFLDFEEDEGTKAYDKSGYGNNGTLEGSTSWINGKYGNALKFNPATGDYVGVNDSKSIRLRDAIQVEAWIKTADTSGVRMAIADRYTGNLDLESGWLLFLTNVGKLRFHIGTSATVYADATGTTDLRDNQWHHVIGTYNKSVIQIFVDGKLEGYTMFSGNIWNETSIPTEYGLNIGRRCDVCGGSSASLFNGIIDEIKIYNNVTSPFRTLYFRMD